MTISIRISPYRYSYRLLPLFFFLLLSTPLFSQPTGIKGAVKDGATGETLIGATVVYEEGKGTATDINGNYFLELPDGEYTVSVSYVGYVSQNVKVKVAGKTIAADFTLENLTLSEVEIVADVARSRETPVAFANVLAPKLEENLASRDIPMVLNSTPGIYATEQGGGAGDARITIRGFDQRNVAVMVDGIPVNDMETGWVYWSNWDGLGDVTRSVQVQRGLGASKLAISSVGGTMNIITKGIESKRGGSYRQEYGSDGFLKESLVLTSGKLKGGFGVTLAGTRKTGDGWTDRTWTDAYSYFLRMDKRLGTHTLSIAGNGAPQRHAQRKYQKSITTYSTDYAAELFNGDSANYIDTAGIKARGFRYNMHWGKLDRWEAQNGDTVHHDEILDEQINYFHKPQFWLRDFWTISEKAYWSNIVYVSIGNGGGTANSKSDFKQDSTGQYDYQAHYNTNKKTIDFLFDSLLHKSTRFIRSSINNHRWYGWLSTFNYDFSQRWALTAGIDMRMYKGTHYREVYDLLGGDYYIETIDKNQPKGTANMQYRMKRKGDKISYYYDGLVRWGGVFSQLEFKEKKISAFVTGTASYTGYERIDYFMRKDLVLDGKVYAQTVGWGDTLFYNGTDTLLAFYNSTITRSGDTTFVTAKNVTRQIIGASGYSNSSIEARFANTGWKWFLGYTVKGGANYNINEKHNVFINLGYLTKAPRFNNVFDFNNLQFVNSENEIVKAVELGYGFKTRKYVANVNGYFTSWKNKPLDAPATYTDPEDGLTYSYNINGLAALHRGIEVDAVCKIVRNIDVEGLVSLGDWIWNSTDTTRIYDDNGNLLKIKQFSAIGVHVGNAAQIQYGASVRYEIIKNLYLKTQGTYFGKNYSNLNALDLNGANSNRESWKLPDYYMVDCHAGYEFAVWKLKIGFAAHVLNVLDNVYIADATNNGAGKDDFDAKSAGVFFGLGRRYIASMKITF